MKKRIMRLALLVAVITLPLVMGACATLPRPGPRNTFTMRNDKVPYYPHRDSNFAKWGRGILGLLASLPRGD